MFAPTLNATSILSLLFLSFLISTSSVKAESAPQIFLQIKHTDWVLSVSFSPDGKQIASGSDDTTVKIWDTQSGMLRRALSGHTASVWSVSFSPDGKQIASGSSDNRIKIWDAQSGTLRRTLSGHTASVWSVSFSPDGKQIASGSYDSTVKTWDAQSGMLQHTFRGHTGSVRSVSFSPDGKQIASGSYDTTVKIWDAQSGMLRRTLSGHTASVWSVSFSPDGKQIASGSYDNTIKIWDAQSGTLRRTLSDHTAWVWSVSFSPDGKQIASGSYDNTVKIWDAQSGTLRRTLSGHTAPAWSVSFSPDAKWIASGSYDNTVKIRDAVYGSLLINMVSLTRPPLKQKRFRLWWEKYQNKSLRVGGIIFIIATIIAFRFILRNPPDPLGPDPLEVPKQFFAKATSKKMIEYPPEKLFRFDNEYGQTDTIVSIWGEEEFSSDILDARHRVTNTPNKKIKLYLVYGAQRPSSKTIQSLRGDRFEVIPILFDKMEKALFIERDKGIRELLQEFEAPFIARIDPYAESKPILDPIWFYGRNDLIERLPEAISQGQNVGIFGLRKVGKTSLIKQMQQRFIKTPTVYIDCQAFSPRALTYFNEILQQLRTELLGRKIKPIPSVAPVIKDEQFNKHFLDMFKLWQNEGEQDPFIIILDEIDKLFPSRELRDSENIHSEYVRFYRVLRGLAQSKQCLVTLVVAYRPDVNRHNLLHPTVGENPMFKSFKEEYLGFLNSSDSLQMVQGIGAWRDIIWEKKAADRVFYYCGGHPLVSRYFASTACKQGSRKTIDFLQVENTAKTIQKTFYKNEIGNYYEEGIWALLHEKEKDLLSLICRGEDQNPLEKQIAVKYDEALANLGNYNIVANENGTLKITAQLFYAWAKRKLSR